VTRRWQLFRDIPQDPKSLQARRAKVYKPSVVEITAAPLGIPAE